MKSMVFAETPEYRENAYLQSPTFDFREALLLLEQNISQEELDCFCRRMTGEGNSNGTDAG